MAEFPGTSCSLLRSSSTSSGTRRSLSLKRFCRLPSSSSDRTSSSSSSQSPPIGITSSETCTPAGSVELAGRIALCSERGSPITCVASNGGGSLITIQSGDDQVTLQGQRLGSPTYRSRLSLGTSAQSTNREVETIIGPALIAFPSIYDNPGDASGETHPLIQTLTSPNWLETEMNVTVSDYEDLRRLIEILSLEPPTSALSRDLTLRTMTISKLKFPDTTKHSLDALLTNSFTPSQLPAARDIQRFIQANPDTLLPRFLITTEIAEMHGDYGWCLIGKCGLQRIAYKIAHLMPKDGVTEQELERDRSRRHIHRLSGHIQTQHFENMRFRCHLCPASYINQNELSRHWRTSHALGEFPCTTCGDILTSEASLHTHRHSNKIKTAAAAKLLRLLPRAIPRRRKCKSSPTHGTFSSKLRSITYSS